MAVITISKEYATDSEDIALKFCPNNYSGNAIRDRVPGIILAPQAHFYYFALFELL